MSTRKSKVVKPGTPSKGRTEGAASGEGDTSPQAAAETAPRRAPSGGGGSALAVGRSLEIDMPADMAMDNVAEKLKLLNYEKEFCRRKRPFWTPVSRSYFAVPSPNNNQNEQFFYFTSLVSWLLGLTGKNFTPPAQFDDPNAACTNILTVLKDMGFAAPSFPPAKLKQGYGEPVCGVLDNLLDLVLERTGWKFQKAVYQPDGYVEDADVDDGTDMGVGTDNNEDLLGMGPQEPDEEEAYMETNAETKNEKAEDSKILESKVDASEWRLELERVGPQLRVTVLPDGKDWRAHLEETHAHQETIMKSLPDTTAQLNKVESEVVTALEKVGTREKFINNQLEHLTRDYRTLREQLASVQERYQKTTENVAELTNELGHISEELENVKQTVADRGENINDASPLVKIKDAITKLKTELKAMEVRIGVAEHALLQTHLKNKNSIRVERSGKDYDSEEGF